MGAYYKTVKSYATPSNIRSAYSAAKAVSSMLPKRRKVTFAQKVKKVVHSTDTTQYKLSSPSANLTHNTLFTAGVLGNIATGTGVFNRLSDNIFLTSLSMKILIQPVATNVSTYIRVMAVWSDLDITATNATDAFTTSGLLYTDLFRQTGLNYVPTGHHNINNITFAADKLIKIVPQYAAQQDTRIINLNLKLNKPYKYLTGSNFSSKKNLYIVIASNITGGTDGVTPTGALSSQSILRYKNAQS